MLGGRLGGQDSSWASGERNVDLDVCAGLDCLASTLAATRTSPWIYLSATRSQRVGKVKPVSLSTRESERVWMGIQERREAVTGFHRGGG